MKKTKLATWLAILIALLLILIFAGRAHRSGGGEEALAGWPPKKPAALIVMAGVGAMHTMRGHTPPPATRTET
ncbi:MAG: hypothetical protein OD817_06185 [Gammaproteobacteria bacterium]